MSNNLELRRFASDVSINLIRVTVMTLMGIGISIGLARGLGTEGKGYYELGIFLPTVLQAIFNIGSQQSTIYYVANTQHELGYAGRGGLTLAFWNSIVGVSIGFLTITFGGNILFPGVSSHLLYLSLLLLPLLYTRINLSAIFQGKQNFRAFSTIELLPYIVNFVVLALTIWWFPDRIAAALAAVIIGNLVAVIYGMRLLHQETQLGWGLFTWQFDSAYVQDMLRYGLKNQWGLVMLFLLFRVDVYLINQIGGGADSVGIYSIAVVLAERIWVFTGFASQVMLPRIASWKGEEEKRTLLTLMTMRFTLWLSFVIVGLVIVFGRVLISLMFGEQFVPSVTALYLIIPGIIMYNFSRVLGADMTARGKPEVNSALFTLGLVVNILANLILIPSFDFRGAAMASSIAYSVLGLGTLLVFCRMYKTNPIKAVWLNSEDRERIGQVLAWAKAKSIRQ